VTIILIVTDLCKNLNGVGVSAMKRELLRALLSEYADDSSGIVWRTKPIDVNSEDVDGETPIFAAIYRGNIREVEILIDFGADINKCGGIGLRPLHVAVIGGNVNIVEFLLMSGASYNYASDSGSTALAMATESKNTEIIKIIEKYSTGK
jgi:Ankyrin repeats (many copies)